jgi:hypothetical protein
MALTSARNREYVWRESAAGDDPVAWGADWMEQRKSAL